MISLILVSHCKMITDGLKRMIDEMASNREHVRVFSAGGLSAEELGTNPLTIYDTLLQCQMDKAILIFTDMGSAILSAEAAMDMLEDELKSKVHLIEAPLVEGAFLAAVQSDGSDNVAAILAELKAYSFG